MDSVFYKFFLAFFLLDKVEDAFHSATFHIQMNSPELMVVLNYFENTYFGQVVPETEERTTPRFPISFWNHHERISVDPTFPRTSNLVEGFHGAFRTRLSKSKPIIIYSLLMLNLDVVALNCRFNNLYQ
jgi:hypothetical protein